MVTNTRKGVTDVVELLEASSGYKDPVGQSKTTHPWQQVYCTYVTGRFIGDIDLGSEREAGRD
jgi:hypothetical protein